MQTIAQQYQSGYQEQISTAVLFPIFPMSCTPHRPKARFHLRYDDFREICDYIDPDDPDEPSVGELRYDDPSADVLRYMQMRTDWLIDQLRKAHGIPEDYLPAPEDLWFSASYRDIEEGIVHAQSFTTCGRCLKDKAEGREPPSLIERGFVERRFIARPGPAVTQRPKVTFYEDDKGIFIIVADRWGNYVDAHGEQHNATREGYDFIEWQYRYCIDAVNRALAGPWYDPPKPLPPWKPLTRQRNPVLEQQNQGEEAHIRQDQASSADTSKPTSLASAKEGVQGPLPSEALPISHDTVDTKGMSTVEAKNGLNFPETSAISNVLPPAEDFSAAPWCPETLIGLASSRCIPGLFECTGSDEDYEGAKKLDRLRLSLGLDPIAFWPVLDRHIAAMMDPNSETWWACRRKGKNLRFNLIHVDSQWNAVGETLTKKPWYPLDTVPYFGPLEDPENEDKPRDLSWIFGVAPVPDAAESPPEESPVIVEGSLESPGATIEIRDVQEDTESPGETEQNEMHQMPPPVEQWPQEAKRGMDQTEFDALCQEIWQRYPTVALEARPYADGSLAVGIEHHPGVFMRVRNAAEWRRPPTSLQRAVKDAVAYGRATQSFYGMGLVEYDALCREIWRRYPMLLLGNIPFDDGSCGLVIGYAEDAWTEPLRCEAEWHDLSPTMYRLVERAILYGESRRSNDSDDS
jgi:hypothetical protein